MSESNSKALSEQGLILYKLMHERISDLKKQHWTITNYVVLFYAAIFVVAKEITVSGWRWWLAAGALLVACGYGIACLGIVQIDLGCARKRLDDADSDIFGKDEAR